MRGDHPPPGRTPQCLSPGTRDPRHPRGTAVPPSRGEISNEEEHRNMTSRTPRRHRRLALMAAGTAAAMVLLPGAASAQVVHSVQQIMSTPGGPAMPGDPVAPPNPLPPTPAGPPGVLMICCTEWTTCAEAAPGSKTIAAAVPAAMRARRRCLLGVRD